MNNFKNFIFLAFLTDVLSIECEKVQINAANGTILSFSSSSYCVSEYHCSIILEKRNHYS